MRQRWNTASRGTLRIPALPSRHCSIEQGRQSSHQVTVFDANNNTEHGVHKYNVLTLVLLMIEILHDFIYD